MTSSKQTHDNTEGQCSALASPAGSAEIREALDELRSHRDTCGLYRLTFAPNAHKLTEEQRDQMEAYLQHGFHLWWDTWIKPKLDTIEANLPNVKVRDAG